MARDAGPSTGSGSFYCWLNGPAAADAAGGLARPVVTELAHRIYLARADVSALFPDIFGKDRAGFTEWFGFDGCAEYALDRAFSVPVVQSWASVPRDLRADGVHGADASSLASIRAASSLSG